MSSGTSGAVAVVQETPGLAAPALWSTITCPHCGTARAEMMPTDACIVVYDCAGCEAVLRPKRGDCCVFCSYGDTPCPPIQLEQPCCAGRPEP